MAAMATVVDAVGLRQLRFALRRTRALIGALVMAAVVTGCQPEVGASAAATPEMPLAELRAKNGVQALLDTCWATLPSLDGIESRLRANGGTQTASGSWTFTDDGLTVGVSDGGCIGNIAATDLDLVVSEFQRSLRQMGVEVTPAQLLLSPTLLDQKGRRTITFPPVPPGRVAFVISAH